MRQRLRRLICWLAGHRYAFDGEARATVPDYGGTCKRCGTVWTWWG